MNVQERALTRSGRQQQDLREHRPPRQWVQYRQRTTSGVYGKGDCPFGANRVDDIKAVNDTPVGLGWMNMVEKPP